MAVCARYEMVRVRACVCASRVRVYLHFRRQLLSAHVRLRAGVCGYEWVGVGAWVLFYKFVRPAFLSARFAHVFACLCASVRPVCVHPCVFACVSVCVCDASACVHVRARVRVGPCVCARAHVRLPAFLSETISPCAERVERVCAGTLVARRGPAVLVARPRRVDGHLCFGMCHRSVARVVADMTFISRTPVGSWGARYGHTSVIDAAGAIYVIGGVKMTYGGPQIPDVWASTNGGAHRSQSRVLEGV